MLSPKMLDALNQQINREFASAYLYLAMAAQCEAQSLPGMAHWMKRQATEEYGHGMRLFELICDRGGRVSLAALPQPPAEFGSPLELFQQVLSHERKVTAYINAVYELALDEKDYASQVALHWFVNEQVEEEKNASVIVDQLKAIPDKSSAILFLDRQLGKRS
jgi:ferritin